MSGFRDSSSIFPTQIKMDRHGYKFAVKAGMPPRVYGFLHRYVEILFFLQSAHKAWQLNTIAACRAAVMNGRCTRPARIMRKVSLLDCQKLHFIYALYGMEGLTGEAFDQAGL